MPIDGTIWTEKPVNSSYPSSRVFEIVRRDYPESAHQVLRQIREAIMLRNEDISKRSVLKNVLDKARFDSERILEEAEGAAGQELLMQDLQMVQALQASGFPTVVLVNNQNQGLKIVGAQPFEALVQALKQILPEGTSVVPESVPSLSEVVKEHPTLMSKEIEVLYDLNKESVLEYVVAELTPDQFKTEMILNERYFHFL